MITARTADAVGVALRICLGGLGLAAVSYQLSIQIADGAPVANFLSFFTIESNIVAALVLVATGLLPLSRRPGWWDGLRGAATLYMVTTGIVYNTLLLDVDVGNLAPWVNNVLHRIMPLVILADWLLALPRERVSRRTSLLWLIFPILYCAYSLIRGPYVDFYPYPFLDPRLDGGYGRVAIFIAVLSIAIAGLALLVAWVGNRSSFRRHQAVPARR
ncbi:Pr6Pr family membrane protein [soil metagenome]|jgi:hypothetical protein